MAYLLGVPSLRVYDLRYGGLYDSLQLLGAALDDAAPLFAVDGASRRERRRFLSLASDAVVEHGDVAVLRELSTLDEESLLDALHDDLEQLAGELARSQTERHFSAEMLSVARGQRTFESASLEARLRLRELESFDPWTGPDSLRGALRVVSRLGADSGRRPVLLYGEAHLLEEQALSGLLEALAAGQAPDARPALLCLCGASRLVGQLSHAIPERWPGHLAAALG